MAPQISVKENKKMKLSKAQQDVFDDVRRQINEARATESFEEYFNKYHAPRNNNSYNTIEKCNANDPHYLDYYKTHYEELKAGISLTHCSGPTIQKLQKLGLIEIIEDSTNTNFSCDKVRAIF